MQIEFKKKKKRNRKRKKVKEADVIEVVTRVVGRKGEIVMNLVLSD